MTAAARKAGPSKLHCRKSRLWSSYEGLGSFVSVLFCKNIMKILASEEDSTLGLSKVQLGLGRDCLVNVTNDNFHPLKCQV